MLVAFTLLRETQHYEANFVSEDSTNKPALYRSSVTEEL